MYTLRHRHSTYTQILHSLMTTLTLLLKVTFLKAGFRQCNAWPILFTDTILSVVSWPERKQKTGDKHCQWSIKKKAAVKGDTKQRWILGSFNRSGIKSQPGQFCFENWQLKAMKIILAVTTTILCLAVCVCGIMSKSSMCGTTSHKCLLCLEPNFQCSFIDKEQTNMAAAWAQIQSKKVLL